jgi:uncharacterized membrane protein
VTNIDHRAGRAPNAVGAFLLLVALASFFYTFHLSSWSLGASEAYSALAASQSSFAEVIREATRFDPGKPPLYQMLLHCFVSLFGKSETSLRGFSVFFALLALPPLYSLGVSLFGPEIAIVAVAIWALNPVALILGQWARMYSLFIAAVLFSMLFFWLVREQPSKRRIVGLGLLTAIVLYTHLCGILFVGAEMSLVVRDFYRGRRIRGTWQGIALGFALFIPFVPQEILQARQLLLGHWLDWIGIANSRWSLGKSLAVAGSVVTISLLLFGPLVEKDQREPVRFCAIWLGIPILVLEGVSIVARPVFALRYVAAALPALALLLGRGLEAFGGRVRNLSTASIATAFAVLFFFCKAGRYEPWRDIAQEVSTADFKQTVFFESPLGVLGVKKSNDRDLEADKDFPEGYFKVPFDYYFKGLNPHQVVNPFDPVRSRQEISDAVLRAGGAWLVSGCSDEMSRLEMPTTTQFRVSRLLRSGETSLYHIVAQ